MTNPPAPPPPPPPPPALALPMDLVLEVVERCDPATLISCAATCRRIRRHVLSPAFIQRRRRRAGAAARASSCFLGFFHRHHDYDGGEHAPTSFPPPPAPPLFVPASPTTVRTPSTFTPPDVFDRYTPVASRGGLLVLRRRTAFVANNKDDNLCVYDPITGRCAFLPRPQVHPTAYALLLDDDDRWFRRLIAVDLSDIGSRRGVRSQTLSAADDDGAWGPVREAPAAPVADVDPMRCHVARPSSPVILGGGVVLHWLCICRDDSNAVLTFHADTGELGTVPLPPHHVFCPDDDDDYYCCSRPKQQLLLASSAEGELSLMVAGRQAISVWVMVMGPAATTTGPQWTRRAVVDLEKDANLRLPTMGTRSSCVQLEWAGERSGAVVAQVAGVGLVALDVMTKKAVCTVRGRSNSGGGTVVLVPFRYYCPYECDLVARLAGMAPI